MLVQDRDSSRRVFVDTWLKYQNGGQPGPLEKVVLGVILQHPEYHRWLDHDEVLNYDFNRTGETENPFLHMGLHIAIHEQISTDRPPGTLSCYRALLARYPDEHVLYHRMMGCLGSSLWQAQRDGRMPDEAAYLECLRKLA